MEQRVTVITLGVADLGRSARFYEDGLGWRRATRDEGVVFFQLPGAVLSLWSRAIWRRTPASRTGRAALAG